SGRGPKRSRTSRSFTPAHFEVAVQPCMHEWIPMYSCRDIALRSSKLKCLVSPLSSPPSSSLQSDQSVSRCWSHSGDSSSVGGRPFVQWNSEMSFSVKTFCLDMRDRIQFKKTP